MALANCSEDQEEQKHELRWFPVRHDAVHTQPGGETAVLLAQELRDGFRDPSYLVCDGYMRSVDR